MSHALKLDYICHFRDPVFGSLVFAAWARWVPPQLRTYFKWPQRRLPAGCWQTNQDGHEQDGHDQDGHQQAAAKMESCASALELDCTNTSAKKCANHARRKLRGEERRRQKGELLLTRGIEELSAEEALRHALEDATATFACLSPKPSMEPQQPITIRRRTEPFQPPAKINLPPPPEGQKLYSLRQAMAIISASSGSVNSIATEMIRRGLVPVKRAAMFRYTSKYVDEGKPEAPVLWTGGMGRQEIM